MNHAGNKEEKSSSVSKRLHLYCSKYGSPGSMKVLPVIVPQLPMLNVHILSTYYQYLYD